MPEVERRIVLRDGEGRELAPRPAKEPELVYFPGGWYALDEEKAEKLRRLMRELGEPVSKTYNPMVPISIPIMPWQTAT